jgi:hypothetical protein
MSMKKISGRFLLSVAALLGLCSVGLAASGFYTSATDLELSSQDLLSASAGRDILFNGVMVNGRVSAGRNVTCHDCTLSGGVAAGNDVQLEHCAQVHSVASGHNAALVASRILSHVSSGHDVSLDDVTVDNGLQAGNQVTALNSTMNGTVSLGGHYARLEHSNAAEIRFEERGHSVISQGVYGGSVIVGGGRSGSHVSVGAHSLSSVNGYTIKGAPEQTTVITPEQTIYVNGRRVDGAGPKSYAEYRNGHPEAPEVQGPGWVEGSESGERPLQSRKNEKGPVVNVLELVNNSVVNGPVVFESGFGKIRVEKGSQFNGKVMNGTVERF